jgi:hypothetical protein
MNSCPPLHSEKRVVQQQKMGKRLDEPGIFRFRSRGGLIRTQSRVIAAPFKGFR